MVFEKWESTIMPVGWEHLENIFLSKIISLAVLWGDTCWDKWGTETAAGNFRLSPASGRQHSIRLSWKCLENVSIKDHASCCGVNTFPAKSTEMDLMMSKTRKLLSLCWDTASEDSQGGGVQSPALADAKLYNPYTELMNACVGNGTWGNYWHTFY